MKTIYLNLAEMTASAQSYQQLPPSVLTIGNFDGVHLGHQAMLDQVKDTANSENLATMVMVFEPQPREYFAALKGNPELAPARLTSKNEKLLLLQSLGVDAVVVATFDSAFRSLSANEFATMLTEKLNVAGLVLGDDFRFGNDRTGDSDFLRTFGLPVTNLPTITDTYVQSGDSDSTASSTAEAIDDRISSTRIRELLGTGNLDTANRLLGRDYTIIGKVVRGDQIGRTLNFPTANIELNRLRPALHGVYGVDVTVVDDTGTTIDNAFTELAIDDNTGIAGLRRHSLFGTANIGLRPSIDKAPEWRLEVFFPEFSGDLYGKTLAVRFLHHLHDERKYDGLDALKAGINQDVQDLLTWRKSCST